MKINLLIDKIERNHHIIMLIILLMMLLAPLAYSQAQPCVTGLTETHTDVSCNGAMNGSVTLSALIPTGGLNYLWSDGNTDQNRTGLAPGTYMVTTYDGEYCSDSLSVTISEPTELIVTESHIITICGSSLNSILVSVSGGTVPYSFLWNDGNTNQDRDHLGSGAFTVTVTDSGGCAKQLTVNFNNVSFQCSIIKTQIISCYGSCDGSLKVGIPAGTPFSYLWSTGQTTRNIYNLCGGTYTVTVTNGFGCSRTLSTNLCGTKKLVPVATTTAITAHNANDGTVIWTTKGGTQPYSYLWSDGYTTGNRTNIAAGKYTITITDAHSCTVVTTKKWVNPPLRMSAGDIADDLTISPNPSSGKFEIEINAKNNSQYTVEVIDLEGRTILSKKYELTEGAQQLTIDMSQKPKGIYTLCVSCAERRFVKKLVMY
ncbi:MAG: T9SS type A sorting domain-containing protein [Bacteroidia bacterium]